MTTAQHPTYQLLRDALYLTEACSEIAAGHGIYPTGVASCLARNVALRAKLPLTPAQDSAIAAYSDRAQAPKDLVQHELDKLTAMHPNSKLVFETHTSEEGTAPAATPAKQFKFAKPECKIGIIGHVDMGKSSVALALARQMLQHYATGDNLANSPAQRELREELPIKFHDYGKRRANSGVKIDIQPILFDMSGSMGTSAGALEEFLADRNALRLIKGETLTANPSDVWEKFALSHENAHMPVGAPLSAEQQALNKAAYDAAKVAAPAIAAALPAIIKAAAVEIKALGQTTVNDMFDLLYTEHKLCDFKRPETTEGLRTLVEYAQPEVDTRPYGIGSTVRERAAGAGHGFITSLPLAPHAQPKAGPARKRGSMAADLKLLG